MIDPFRRARLIFLAEATLGDTIKDMTAGKGRKYVSYKSLQDKLELDDAAFNDLMKRTLKANRHSNKYIFTDSEDGPAVGIAASKRKRKEVRDDVPSANSAIGVAHKVTDTMYKPEANVPAEKRRVIEARETELWKIWHQNGWRGFDRLGLLPEGWQDMTGKQIVEEVINAEFKDYI